MLTNSCLELVLLSIIAPGITTHPFLKNDAEIHSVMTRAGFKKVKINRKKKLFHEIIHITASK